MRRSVHKCVLIVGIAEKPATAFHQSFRSNSEELDLCGHSHIHHPCHHISRTILPAGIGPAPAPESSGLGGALLDNAVAGKFTIRTCSSTACAARRRHLRQDEYSTFSAFWVRGRDRAPTVRVEEGPCLGACADAPCVAIEHDDYVGPVSLEGMTPDEFARRVFVNVRTEADADRIWNCVENAIHIMALIDDEPYALHNSV